VPRRTLSNRILGIPLRLIKVPNLRKLILLEEEAIIRYIPDLDSRVFPLRRSTVKDMANRLLAERNGGVTGRMQRGQ
jgi:hypothetical protein